MRCEPSFPDRELNTTRTLKVNGNSMTFCKHSFSLPQARQSSMYCNGRDKCFVVGDERLRYIGNLFLDAALGNQHGLL